MVRTYFLIDFALVDDGLHHPIVEIFIFMISGVSECHTCAAQRLILVLAFYVRFLVACFIVPTKAQ